MLSPVMFCIMSHRLVSITYVSSLKDYALLCPPCQCYSNHITNGRRGSAVVAALSIVAAAAAAAAAVAAATAVALAVRVGHDRRHHTASRSGHA